MASLAGQTFEKYEVLDEVGHGGMAVVYRARDTVLQREVAIKVLHAHLADRAESRERLKREAITVAKLRHDNIVEIFDYSGEDTDQAYLVTEFIHGKTLRAWIEGAYEPRPAVAALLIRTLAMALDAAHALNIVHRDIKPDNVMIREDGCLKLMDFGIAQLVDQQKLTMTGQLLGSPAFMAPELISGKPVDHRIDVFSLGIMLYQLATGTLPFSGRNPHEVLNRIADCDFPRPSSVNPLVDEGLEQIISRALARDAEQRYPTAAALAEGLATYLDELGVRHTDDSELVAYFHDPAAYVEELDRRIIARLMEQARDCAARGQSARAIRTLARVLERDPQHVDAQALLVRMRRRGRQLRQLLFAGGGALIVGLFVAAVTLRGGDPPRRLRAAPAPELGSVASPFVIIPIDDTAEPAWTGPDASSAPVSQDEPGLESAPRPTTSRAGSPGRIARAVRIAPASRTETTCLVEVAGAPVPHLTHHRLDLAGRKFSFDGTRQVYEVALQTERARARLAGERWEGTVPLERSACAEGPVVLRATPKPARIIFRDLPAGISDKDVAVRCLEGCSEEGDFAHRWSTRVPFGNDRKAIRLLLTAEADGVNYRSERAYNLYPGPNRLDARLVALDSGASSDARGP